MRLYLVPDPLVPALLARRPLELAQDRVAAAHAVVQRLLWRLLAGQRVLELFRDDVADLHHVAEADAARVLGRLLVGELLDRRLAVRELVIEARCLDLLVGG